MAPAKAKGRGRPPADKANPSKPAKPAAKKELDLQVLRVGKQGIFTIPGLRTEKVLAYAIGTSPLVAHRFADKIRKQMLAKHEGEASQGREKKVPRDNYNAARHLFSDGVTDGFPAGALMACILGGFSRESGVARTRAKGSLRVAADDIRTNLIKILTPMEEPEMHEGVVRLETGVPDIRHRPLYWPWAMRLEIEYLPNFMSVKQLMQAAAISGFRGGIGEHRPSAPKSMTGTWGTWRLANHEEAELIDEDPSLESLWEYLGLSPEEWRQAA